MNIKTDVHLRHIFLSKNFHIHHNYTDPQKTIISQGVRTSKIIIEDDVLIGANSVILAGITIGQHSIIGAGTIVTQSVPPNSVVAGNPGKVIKQYNPQTKEWENIHHEITDK